MPSNGDSKGVIGGKVGSERRRSSASSGKFAGLMNQKRNSSDATAAARKSSFDDQKPATGIIGSMWNRYVLDKACQKVGVKRDRVVRRDDVWRMVHTAGKADTLNC
ncbi:hypothetical protein MMC30_001091 [Trapelia coarctata]|nr:hypothetical protein [Trapelia coarctata]